MGFESEGNCQIEDLRREISGLSQLASELYSVTQISDTDRVSLDRSGMTIWIKTNKYSIILAYTTAFFCAVGQIMRNRMSRISLIRQQGMHNYVVFIEMFINSSLDVLWL